MMNVETLGNARVDLLQEFWELGGAMAPVVFADHKPDAMSRTAHNEKNGSEVSANMRGTFLAALLWTFGPVHPRPYPPV
jgi:hypothetical protein